MFDQMKAPSISRQHTRPATPPSGGSSGPVAFGPKIRRILGRDWAIGLVFVLPVALILLALVAYPFLSSIWLSLNAKRLGGAASFVGLGNYVQLFQDKRFLQAAGNTIVYTFGGVGLKLLVGMVSALVLNQALPPRNLWRMLLFLPWSIPVVIGAFTWRFIYDGLNGILSQALYRSGLVDHIIYFLSDPQLALRSVLAVVVWQGTPFYTMNFLAGLAAIPQEYYEAAELDGADDVRKFIHITLPFLTPVTIIVTLLSTIWTSNEMQFVYVLTRGGPHGVTLTLPVLAYQTAMELRELGLGAATSLMFFPILAIIMFVLTRRILREEE